MLCACRSLMATRNSVAAMICRVTVGIVMLPHGLQKTIGAFGGGGYEATMNGLTSSFNLSPFVVSLVIAAESLGAIGLIIGFLTRFCAASLAIVMGGAIWLAHMNNGFFMNWFGKQAGEGYEYHLLVIGLCLSVVVSGGGSLSLDKAMCGESDCCSGAGGQAKC